MNRIPRRTAYRTTVEVTGRIEKVVYAHSAEEGTPEMADPPEAREIQHTLSYGPTMAVRMGKVELGGAEPAAEAA